MRALSPSAPDAAPVPDNEIEGNSLPLSPRLSFPDTAAHSIGPGGRVARTLGRVLFLGERLATPLVPRVPPMTVPGCGGGIGGGWHG